MDETKLTKVTFTFEVKANGTAEFSTASGKGFGYYDESGNPVKISEYEYTSKSITIKEKTVVDDGEKEEVEDKKDDSKAKGKMPQTGSETTTIFVIAGLAIIATFVYIKYKRISDI